MSNPGPDQQYLPHHAHEASDVSVRGLAIFLFVLSLSLAAVVGLLVWLFQVMLERARRADPPPPPLAHLRTEPLGPRLQQLPAADMQSLRAEQSAELSQWQWIDRQQQLAHIPIERAMALLAEHGLPDWPAIPPDTQPADAPPTGADPPSDAAPDYAAPDNPPGASAAGGATPRIVPERDRDQPSRPDASPSAATRTPASESLP